MNLTTARDTDRWNVQPSLAARLAQFFHRRPNVWIDGRTLATIAGNYGWRTRVSELRKPPFNMTIENRQRHVRVRGAAFTISEYRFVGDEAADSASTPSAAM